MTSWSSFVGNVAYMKTATQGNKTRRKKTAALAIDGNYGSCAHPTGVDKTMPAWWRVDLGSTYVILSVNITNRGNCKKCVEVSLAIFWTHTNARKHEYKVLCNFFLCREINPWKIMPTPPPPPPPPTHTHTHKHIHTQTHTHTPPTTPTPTTTHTHKHLFDFKMIYSAIL